MRISRDRPLVTHTLKPADDVAQAIERALAKKADGSSGLAEAVQILDALAQEHPNDPRLRRLLGTLRSEFQADRQVTAVDAQRAFANLAAGAKTLRAAARGAGRIHVSEGAEPSAFDRRMMQAVNKLCEKPLAEDNAPAATILTLDGQVLALGVNRAYRPLHDWRRHGEMEALQALDERTYGGMALVLRLYRDSGGQLDPDTSALLDRLSTQGLRDPGFVDTPQTLRAGGFFAADKIAGYARDLAAFVDEGGFVRDADGNLHAHQRELLQEALDEGLIARQELASWSALDRLHSGERGAKMDLYTSLEPCGMCLQNCTSESHVGRIVYGASDPAGGGLSTLPHYADLYFNLERVPFEIIGGVEGKRPQALFDTFFREVYPRVRDRAVADD